MLQVLGALLVPACDQSAASAPALAVRLRQAPEIVVDRTPEREVIDQVQGVEVMVALGWPGGGDVARRITPLSLTIRNAGREPVVVRYEAFALVSGRGDRYAVLPPFALEGPADRPRLASEYRINPRIATADYLVAPYCERLYAGIPVYEAPFGYDPLYHRHYRAEWERAGLPAPELIQHAIPEGVIKAGGSVSGFLYFQRVEPVPARLTFQATLVNPETGRRFGAVSIPLELGRPT